MQPITNGGRRTVTGESMSALADEGAAKEHHAGTVEVSRLSRCTGNQANVPPTATRQKNERAIHSGGSSGEGEAVSMNPLAVDPHRILRFALVQTLSPRVGKPRDTLPGGYRPRRRWV